MVPRRGRKVKGARERTAAALDRVLALLEHGLTRRAACVEAGIDRKTFQRRCRADFAYAGRVEAAERRAARTALPGEKRVRCPGWQVGVPGCKQWRQAQYPSCSNAACVGAWPEDGKRLVREAEVTGNEFMAMGEICRRSMLAETSLGGVLMTAAAKRRIGEIDRGEHAPPDPFTDIPGGRDRCWIGGCPKTATPTHSPYCGEGHERLAAINERNGRLMPEQILEAQRAKNVEQAQSAKDVEHGQEETQTQA